MQMKKGVFWVNIAIFKLNLLYRYCLKLIGELRKEKEFRQQYCRNSTKIRREKDKKVERERRGISATLLPKFLCPNSCPSCAKKSNCGNAIAEIGKKEIFFWAIVTMTLLKMGGKKKNFVAKIWEEIFKKSVTFSIFL